MTFLKTYTSNVSTLQEYCEDARLRQSQKATHAAPEHMLHIWRNENPEIVKFWRDALIILR
jgi:hypothetical protein